MRIRLASLWFVAALSGASGADAAPITWLFKGEVTTIFHSTHLDPMLPIGTQVSFTATFDNSLPDLCGSAGRGFYFLPGGTVSFGSNTYASSQNALELNAPGGACLGSIPDQPQQASIRYLGMGAPMGGVTVGWINGPDLGDVMPTLLPDPAFGHFNFCATGVTCGDISGRLTSVEVIPEPTTLLLTATGVAVLLQRRYYSPSSDRRSRRRSASR